MKANKLNLKKSFFVWLLCAVVAGTSFTGCSKDDDGEKPSGGDIGIAVGTFKGNLTLTDSGDEYFDAIVTVSKDGDGKLKVTPKSGEEYSSATSKTFPVVFNGTAGPNADLNTVLAMPSAVEGVFLYVSEGETLNLATYKQSDAEVIFTFEGTKQ